MQLELSKKEFRRLLDMVYIGNWILNSTRGADRFEDYDLVESKLFSQCRKEGMQTLVEKWQGRMCPPVLLPMAASMRPLWTMRIRCFLRSWRRSWLAAIWSIRRYRGKIMMNWSPEWMTISRNLRLTVRIIL